MNKLRKPQSDFTIVPNALLRDDRLSLKAKGLYALLFCKPDEWVYIEEVLVRESLDGRDSFRSGIVELAEAGWLRKEQVRVEGVFSHTEIWLHNAAVDVSAVDGSTVDGKPVDGKSDANNTDLSKTDSLSASAKPTKAPKGANPRNSIASALEQLEAIPNDLRLAAEIKHQLDPSAVDGEWAKFRNHHISARSKHTRVDLCWDTWCRRAAEFKARRGTFTGGAAGQGGYKRHDHVAAAKDRALDELFPDRAKGHAWAPAAADTGPNPFGDGENAIDAVFVDVGQGAGAGQNPAGGAGRGDTNSDGRTPLPLEVE